MIKKFSLDDANEVSGGSGPAYVIKDRPVKDPETGEYYIKKGEFVPLSDYMSDDEMDDWTEMYGEEEGVMAVNLIRESDGRIRVARCGEKGMKVD